MLRDDAIVEACADARFLKRFWAKVDKMPVCWHWTGSKNHAAYGGIGLLYRHHDHAFAHRVSWVIHNGRRIPDGMDVLHTCPGGDNPGCVNPAHLRLGDDVQNSLDRSRDGRRGDVRGMRHGQKKLTDASVADIRARCAAGQSKMSIGRLYGVSDTLVRFIVLRRYWTHVA